MFLIDDLIISYFGLTGAAASVATVATGAAMTAGFMSYQSQQNKQAVKSQEKKANAAREAELAFQRFLAGEQSNLTAQQLDAQSRQYELERLTEKIVSSPVEPRIFTLPSAAPHESIFDQVNNGIDRFLRGLN